MKLAPVTVVFTSCQRFDLLERTLASFFAVNDYPLTRVLVVEDSADAGVHAVVDRFKQHGLEVLLNGSRLGQRQSIDRAYASVATEYIFHCEDDWVFGRAGIIRESVDILDADPDIVMVLARRAEDTPWYFKSIPILQRGAARYRKIGPKVHPVWFSFSFNPGLRRLSDYRQIAGGYASLPSEAAISQFYKAKGRAMAALDDARVTHTGDEGRTTYPPPKRTMAWHFSKASGAVQRRTGHLLRLLGLTDGF
jgi:hypothetical protein